MKFPAVLIAILLLALTACGSEAAEPEEAAPPTTPVPMVAPAAPTPTPVPEPSPTATATPQPSPTPAPTATPTPIPEPTPTLPQILKSVSESIVQVVTTGGKGSGVIIDQLGYVLTAAHVVGVDASVTVIHQNGEEERAFILGRDEVRDLAIIKISGGPHLRTVELGNIDAVEVGDQVMVLGYTPFNEATTTTIGIVSQILPHETEAFAYLQTDATFHSGQSGGPVITKKGLVVGIVSRSPASTSPLVTLGWAIAMDDDTKALILRMEAGEVNLTPELPGPGHSRRNPAPINYPVRVLGRYFDGSPMAHDISVTEVLRGDDAWELIQAAHRFNAPAQEGMEYLAARIRMTYSRGPEGQTDWVHQLDFGMLSSQGLDYNIPFWLQPPEPFLSARLYPGATIEAWTVWQVAIDDPAPMLIFGLDSFYRSKAYFSTVPRVIGEDEAAAESEGTAAGAAQNTETASEGDATY